MDTHASMDKNISTPDEVCTQYLRCYTERTNENAKWKYERIVQPAKSPSLLETLINEIGKPYHGWVFVFDTETLTSVDQSLTVGCYAVYGLDNTSKVLLAMAGMLTREKLDTLHTSGLFYDATTVSSNDIHLIQNYAYAKGLVVHTKQEFIKNVFYYWVHKHQALCIGHNLAFDLSRLATNWTKARGSHKGGFSLRVCDCPLLEGLNHCGFHPSIRIRSLGNRKATYSFAEGVRFKNSLPVRDKPDGVYRGKFLDTLTFGLALLGPGPASLLRMGKRFKADILKSQVDAHGDITPEYLDYNVNDVKATFALYQKQRDLYRLHDVDCEPWKIFSGASLGKAYLRNMGFPQFMKQHATFPKIGLAAFMSTYYGGRSEVKLRNQIAECIYTDFKSQYPTVNALQGLQELLLAETITIERNPKAITAWLDNLTVEEFQRPATWKRLRGICKVIPNGDIFPVRSNYSDNSPAANIGVNYVSSNIPTWYTIADVAASRLLTGKTPHIIDAIELIPQGRVATKPMALFGDENYQIDLNKDDLFTSVIDLRTQIRQDAQKFAPGSDEYEYLDGLQMALKLLANSTSYGVLVEVIPDAHEKPQSGVVYADRTIPIKSLGLEKPGPYFAGPVGTLIPAAGRLLLAIAERLGLDRGIRMAMNDTDSAIFARPNNMSRKKFQQCVKEITSFFDPLSPYKSGGTLLEMEDANFGADGQIEPLYFLGVSTKRYVVFNKRNGDEIAIRGFKEHGLGHITSPAGYASPLTCDTDTPENTRWIHDLWLNQILLLLKLKTADLPLSVPVLQRCQVSTSEVLDMYKDIPNIRPFSFFTVLPTISLMNNYGCLLKGSTLYTPFNTSFNETIVKVYRRDTNELVDMPVNMLTSIEDATVGYFNHAEAKSTPEKGIGWLERKHILVITTVPLTFKVDSSEYQTGD